jgi:hypothetical protein
MRNRFTTIVAILLALCFMLAGPAFAVNVTLTVPTGVSGAYDRDGNYYTVTNGTITIPVKYVQEFIEAGYVNPSTSSSIDTGGVGSVYCANYAGGVCASFTIDPNLTAIAALSPTTGNFLFGLGTPSSWALSPYMVPTSICGTGKTLISDGTDFQCAANAFGTAAWSNTGDFAPAFTSANQNLVFATPDGSAGPPGLRALATGDIPDLSGTYAPAFTSGTKNYVFATPDGSDGLPQLRALATGDIPDLSGTYQLLLTSYSDIIAFFNSGTCSGYLKSDGTCDTPGGSAAVIAGTSLSAGSPYYMSASGLAMAKADSDATLPAVCIAVSSTSCMFSGVYQYSATQGWTPGSVLYVSDGTAGALVAVAPSTVGHFVQRVGIALANDTILIMPSLDVGGL